jgi:hypothetical protein
MNRLIRYLLFILFVIVTFYYAWSEGDRRVNESEYSELSANAPQLLIRSIGYDRNAGNVLAIQAFMNVLDYSSSEKFFEKIDSYLLEAKKKGYLNENTVVLFPEHIGTPLVLIGEKKSVYAANTVSSAFTQIAVGNLIGYFKSSFDQSHKNRAEVIFKMKANEMKNIYVDTFRKLSTSYHVTIIAGSILLPQPEINPTSNEISLKGGSIYNTSFIFLPDGKIYPKFGAKQNLAMTEGKIAVYLNPENSFLQFKNMGIVLSNDSLYNSTYADKTRDKEIVLAPSAILEKDEVDWKTEDIYAPKDLPDSTLTQSELWRKYSIFEKTKLSQTNRVTVQVVMLGNFFDLVLEGETSAIIRYVATEGLDNKKPAILNIWL